MASTSKLEELNLSRDELKRLGDALKDEKFRKMLCEYAEEISDPENRRRYEEEIAQMERERGMDVTFIQPEPGYVLKTSVNGDQKAFINISKSDKIDKPHSERKENEEGKSGLMWHIPHSFAPPREDRDKHKNQCQVYDFVVHPDTYRMAESNIRFKKLVEDTAFDGIEKQFQVKVDRKNIKRPKMQFKGTPAATVIRNRSASGPQPEQDASGLLKDMPYPYEDKTTLEKMKEREERQAKEQENKKGKGVSTNNRQGNEEKKSDATVPKYSIIHRSELDMQEYRNAPDAKPSTRPRELVIKIELPLLKSAAQANLDIFEKHLSLESSPPTAYKLDLSLPYPVDDSKGSAKFDKQKRTLVVTLPVIPDDTPSLPSFISNTDGTPETNGTSNHREEKPLIEVLSDEVNSCDGETKTVRQNGTIQENKAGASGVNHDADDGKRFSAAVSYNLPDFSFTQDTETVSFVLKVKNVTENSIKQTSPSSNEYNLVCTSQGEGGFPLHFSLFLRFAESCKVVSEHCTVDVTADNVVLLLLKERSSRGSWDQFWAGLNPDSLEKHLFLTTSNLEQQLKKLDEGATMTEQATMMPGSVDGSGDDGTAPDMQVTAMDEKKLTIKISPKGQSKKWREEDEEDEYDPPSSAEIEVVHTCPNPGLHSILKHSESSEDVEVDSPQLSNEEEDELSSSFNSPGKRRSVSFNKHVDRATFKSSASVNSMKTSLKSKRKRQRKWEEKNDKNSSRRRHNSAGSEGSSDDHMHILSDSHSPSEEEVAAGEEEKGSENKGEIDASARDVLDFRTKPVNDASTITQNDKVEDNNSSESLTKPCQDDVTNNGDNASDEGSNTGVVPSETEGSSGNRDSIGNGLGTTIDSKIKSKLAETTDVDCPIDSDDDDEGKGEQDEAREGQDAGTSAHGNGNPVHNEHRTECAFDFSNDVMFDLDVE